jgi:hypothetical protein
MGAGMILFREALPPNHTGDISIHLLEYCSSIGRVMKVPCSSETICIRIGLQCNDLLLSVGFEATFSSKACQSKSAVSGCFHCKLIRSSYTELICKVATDSNDCYLWLKKTRRDCMILEPKDVIENPIDLRLKVIGLLDNEFHRWFRIE